MNLKAKVFSILIFFSNFAIGAEPKSIPKGQLLDFEGDIIEGESMRPDLFLQISTPDLDLDSISYMRKDFNDFHKIDRNQKPKFVPEKK